MPDKPLWCGRLDEAAAELRALPFPWVDRATVERVLGVGRRRAQQLLQPCTSLQVGANGLAERESFIAHLRRLAAGESVYYERRRRARLARSLRDMSGGEQPQALVAAPVSIVNQDLEDLPEGVTLRPGELVVRFTTAVEALEKLLALAMAVGNDLARFTRVVETGEPAADD